MTTQEKQAVEEAARRNVPTSEDSFFHYSDQDIWIEGFVAGAESALSELHKPGDRPNIKDYFKENDPISDVYDEIIAAPRLYAYMNALDAYIDNLEAKLI
jgi:hypothetical protein